MSCLRYQMEKNENTTKVTISWIVLSCAALNVWMPMRLAGTSKQYSKKAIPQLMSVTFHNGTFWYFKWPYHAKVIKILERIKNTMVNIYRPLSHSQVCGRLQRSTAHAADDGRAIAAGEWIGDFSRAVRAIERVIGSFCGLL